MIEFLLYASLRLILFSFFSTEIGDWRLEIGPKRHSDALPQPVALTHQKDEAIPSLSYKMIDVSIAERFTTIGPLARPRFLTFDECIQCIALFDLPETELDRDARFFIFWAGCLFRFQSPAKNVKDTFKVLLCKYKYKK